MEHVYQIRDWNEHFENDRSRTRDKCSFVCVPNKQHGMGFCRVMAEKDGASIYGIWHLLVGACSQQSSPRNGWLTADGDSAGIAWGVDDLSLKFRRPVQEITRAVDFLSSDKVGWVIRYSINDLGDGNRQLTPDSPISTQKERRKEGKEGRKELPTLDEVKSHVSKIGLPESDAIWFWNKCEGCGWVNGGKPIKSWTHTIGAWKAAGYMPSQKQSQQPKRYTGPNL